MSIDAAQFRALVVQPALAKLAAYGGPPVTTIAADLMMATAAQETHLGQWVGQVGGPGLGIYSIQPLTLANVIRTMPSTLVEAITSPAWTAQEQVVADLRFATICCRWYMWLQPTPLPTQSTPAALWPAYDAMWCRGCAATEAEFIANVMTYAELG